MKSLELKTCELCGRPFTREVGSGRKDCPPCMASGPVVDDERSYDVPLDLIERLVGREPSKAIAYPRRMRAPAKSPWKDPYPGARTNPNRFAEDGDDGTGTSGA